MVTIRRTPWKLALLLLALSAGPAGAEPAAVRTTLLPFTGPSILRGLSLTVDTSPLGRIGGTSEGAAASQLPPAFVATVRKALQQAGTNDLAARKLLRTAIAISGADLYRLNCRSCHGPTGAGKPPAIASIIGPSKALAPAQHEKMMRAAGAEPRPELARQLAQHAEASLQARLSEGGKKPAADHLETMPPFAYIDEPQILALEDFLKALAGVAAKGANGRLAGESVLGVGEQVVRGTCRVCHDATGLGTSHGPMLTGPIPALTSLPERMSIEGVVQKVRRGWPPLAGLSASPTSMPVFPFLSEEEVAAAYLFLAYLPVQAAPAAR